MSVQKSDLEQQLEDARESQAYADALTRLTENADFRKIIMEDFMVHEAARYAASSADPALTAEQKADALAIAQAGGHLKRWLNVQWQITRQNISQIADIEERLAEERAEALKG